MLKFEDTAGSVDERSTERMNFRTKPRIKATIRQAAALSGVDDSVFTMNAAYKAAREVIEAHEATVLSPADHAVFFEALDNPPGPTERLREAFATHKRRVISR